MRKSIKILLCFILFLGLLYSYARYINTYSFKVKEYSIVDKDLPDNFNGLKIVHFSDLLYGRTTNMNTIKKVVKEINKLKPDIVIYTGNLYEGNIKILDNEKELISKELSKIETTLGCFAISGNEDKNDYDDIMYKSNFKLLDNEKEYLYYDDITPILLTNNFEELNDEYIIGLISKPDDIDNLDLSNINVMFSGNSLNGQIRIPFYGAAVKRNGAKKYTDDYYKLDNTFFYISNGLGTKDFSFRTFNSPSINLYRFSNY